MTTPPPIALLAALSIMHTACTGAPTPAGPPSSSAAQIALAKPADPAASTSSPPAPTPPASASLEPLSSPALEYAPRGRRDPFALIGAGEVAPRTVLRSAKLTGIVRGPGGALALVETLDGTGHILRPGEGFGEGRLLEIGVDFVLFDVSPTSAPMPTRIVLRLEPTS